MEKVTFKYEAPRNVDFGTTDVDVTMSFDSEDMTLDEFAGYVRKFCLAIGYHPSSVEQVFPEHD